VFLAGAAFLGVVGVWVLRFLFVRDFPLSSSLSVLLDSGFSTGSLLLVSGFLLSVDWMDSISSELLSSSSVGTSGSLGVVWERGIASSVILLFSCGLWLMMLSSNLRIAAFCCSSLLSLSCTFLSLSAMLSRSIASFLGVSSTMSCLVRSYMARRVIWLVSMAAFVREIWFSRLLMDWIETAEVCCCWVLADSHPSSSDFFVGESPNWTRCFFGGGELKVLFWLELGFWLFWLLFELIELLEFAVCTELNYFLFCIRL
jgi:hypothetical protein